MTKLSYHTVADVKLYLTVYYITWNIYCIIFYANSTHFLPCGSREQNMTVLTAWCLLKNNLRDQVESVWTCRFLNICFHVWTLTSSGCQWVWFPVPTLWNGRRSRPAEGPWRASLWLPFEPPGVQSTTPAPPSPGTTHYTLHSDTGILTLNALPTPSQTNTVTCTCVRSVYLLPASGAQPLNLLLFVEMSCSFPPPGLHINTHTQMSSRTGRDWESEEKIFEVEHDISPLRETLSNGQFDKLWFIT